MDEIAGVTVTADDPGWLADFTRAIVADRLAACGNIVPSIRSIYRWDDAIQDEGEVLVTFHTRRSLVPELIERVKRDHPYDIPQVLALPVVGANPDYQAWVLAETRPARVQQASDS